MLPESLASLEATERGLLVLSCPVVYMTAPHVAICSQWLGCTTSKVYFPVMIPGWPLLSENRLLKVSSNGYIIYNH